jgi:hypothetical protein
MEEYVYILREDMYNEWAWENGATNLISVSHNLDTILGDMKKHLIMEKEEDKERVIGYDIENQDIDSIMQNVEFELSRASVFSVAIYVNEEDYDNGKESGVLVIEEMRVK